VFDDDYETRFVTGLFLPGCRLGRTFRFEDDDQARSYLIEHAASGSWAAVPETGPSTGRIVRQHGPRRLWNELENGYAWWRTAGYPDPTRLGITVTPTDQTVWLDAPSVIVEPSRTVAG